MEMLIVRLTFSFFSNSLRTSESMEIPINTYKSTIMLKESNQGQSSVIRLRLEGHKKPIRGHKNPITNMH